MQAIGYDGNGYSAGDRVELNPATDYWMAGARFGEVISVTEQRVSLTEKRARVRVLLDANGKTITGTGDTFRAVL